MLPERSTVTATIAELTKYVGKSSWVNSWL